jgi:16S rRNA (guanine1207-N2)-methyltransferase
MKSAAKILAKFPGERVVHQTWGQSPANVYNQVVAIWNTLQIDQRVAVVGNKKFGLKKLVGFLQSQGLSVVVVGKGTGDERVLEIHKDSMRMLDKVVSNNVVEFEFGGKDYTVDTGNAVFSKDGLDEGTRYLLEVFFAANIDLSSKNVADLGCGWGAISLVLANTYPGANIAAFEIDDASVDAATVNLVAHHQVEIIKADLTERLAQSVETRRGQYDYIVANPPFHLSDAQRRVMMANAYALLNSGGAMYFVSDAHFVTRFRSVAAGLFGSVLEHSSGKWVVFRCQK